MQELPEAPFHLPALALVGGRGRRCYDRRRRAAHRTGHPGPEQQTVVQAVRCVQLRLLLDECNA